MIGAVSAAVRHPEVSLGKEERLLRRPTCDGLCQKHRISGTKKRKKGEAQNRVK